MPTTPFEENLDDPKIRSKWILIFALALLVHLAALITPWDRIIPAREPFPTPLRVPIQPMDPTTLAKIKKQWRNKTLALPTKQEESSIAPKNARFFSDKNRVTDQETKSRNSDVLPREGPRIGDETDREAKNKRDGMPQTAPKLKDLGLPLDRDGTYSRKRLKTAKNVPILQDGEKGETRAGADQSLLDPELIDGAENLLNTEQSVFYSYYSRLYQEIAPVWSERIKYTIYPKRVLPGEYDSQVDVVFDARGNLVSIFFEKRSGIPEFDQAIVYAWKKIQRFPNPPAEKLDKRGQIHTGWTFHVGVGEGAQFQYAPPERVY